LSLGAGRRGKSFEYLEEKIVFASARMGGKRLVFEPKTTRKEGQKKIGTEKNPPRPEMVFFVGQEAF